MSDLYEVVRRAMASLTEAPGFRPDPVPPALIEEMISVAADVPLGRFEAAPWRFVVVVGDERDQLIGHVAEALARHWGLGSFGPRGLASDQVLNAPALLLVFSQTPSFEGLEAFGVVAGAVQNFVLLAHAAGLATHRIYSAQVVPEAVLDFAGERLGPDIRRGELVAMLALGYPTGDRGAAPTPGAQALWIGRGAPPAPAVDDAQMVAEVHKPTAPLRSSGGERVLLVDPYPYNRELLRAQLEAADYRVEVCASGEELYAGTVERGEPDLYVIAESMADTTGFELVRKLRTRAGAPSAPAPVVITTGRRDSAFRIAGLSAGVDYYLRKPIHPVELYTAARILLERHRLVEELRRANQEQGRLLAQLRATQARLVQHAKMASLGQLVAGVAHEINTPLGAIVSNNDLFLRAFDRLRKSVDATEIAQYAQVRRDLDAVTVLGEVTRIACQRITGIVRSLRTFARLDEAEVKAVDLHDGLESTLVLINHLLKSGISVERRYGALPPVECHPNQINQVFMNLLVNACQAIAGRGTVTIETTPLADDRVQIAISDSGKGISAEILPRIFDPGFTTKGVGVGTGLGLSICYQIVEAHGGDITVASSPGKGATFVVTLPVRPPPRG